MLFAIESDTSSVWRKNQQTPVVRMKRVKGCCVCDTSALSLVLAKFP
jgi:hypothetical protein